MKVSRFRLIAGLRCPWVLVIFLAIVWYSQVIGWGELPGDDGNDELESSVAVKYVDRELLFLETGKNSGSFISWWTGQEERAETLKNLLSVVDRAGIDDPAYLAQLEIERLLALEQKDHQGDAEIPAWLTEEMIFEGMGNGYLGESAIALYLSENDNPRLSLELERREKVLLFRSFVFGSFYLVSISGAIFAVIYLLRRRANGGLMIRGITLWHPSLILAVFFLAEIVGRYLSLYVFYPFIYTYGDYRLGPILDELIWRALGTLIAIAFLAGSVRGVVKIYGLDRPVHWGQLVAVMMCLFLINWIYYLTVDYSGKVDPTDMFLVAFPDKIDLFGDVLNSVIAAPVFEEFMFRGVLFMGLISRLGAVRSALLSSLLFAAVHIQYDLLSLASMVFFGLACCWLVWKTGSLKTAIVLHMIYNAIITLNVYYFYQSSL